MKNTKIPQFIRKSVTIEDALKKMGWDTEVNFSNSDGSRSFYIIISKIFNRGEENEEIFEKKIRFSDHDLPSYYPLADYGCRFDLDKAAWKNLKPKLARLYKETV
jgi:hypothetical protein